MQAGHIVVADHTPDELERERLLQAMGAPAMGCVAAADAWRNGDVATLPQSWVDLREALQAAVDSSDAAQLLNMIDAGVDIDTVGREGRPLLHLLHRFDAEVVSALLDRGPDLSRTDIEGRTALAVAIQQGAVQVVDELLTSGADVSRVGPFGEPALIFAAQRVWTRELDVVSGVAIMHRILDCNPGPYDARAIALTCAVAELAPTPFGAGAGEQLFGGGPSTETIDEMQNYHATRMFEVAVKAEDEPLVHRLVAAGFADWVGSVAPAPEERALRELVRTLVAENGT